MRRSVMSRYRHGEALLNGCCSFGAGYGAACGALFGIAAMLYGAGYTFGSSHPGDDLAGAAGWMAIEVPIALMVGAIVGCACGLLGGVVAGLITSFFPQGSAWRGAVSLGAGFPWLLLLSPTLPSLFV